LTLPAVSQELLKVWGDAIQSGNTRLIKIQIVNGKIPPFLQYELSLLMIHRSVVCVFLFKNYLSL
jgi:hypothetical protein